MKSVGALHIARAWFDPQMKSTADEGLLCRFSSCEITVMLFHAHNFPNKISLFKCTFSNKRQPLPASRIAQGTLFQFCVRLEALVPTLDDAVAESRANFVWVCIPSSLCSWKLLFLQDETALTPNLHRCRGKAGTMPVHPKDNALYPFETCTWICVADSCLFPASCKSQDKEKSFELTQSQMEASVQLSEGRACGAHPSKARRQQMFWQLQLPCTRGAGAGGEQPSSLQMEHTGKRRVGGCTRKFDSSR